MRSRFALAAIGAAVLITALMLGSPSIKDDEELILFDTAAHRDGDGWVVPIHGWIFEPEEASVWRGAFVAGIRRAVDLDPERKDLFRSRVRWFLVDNERSKRLQIRVGTTQVRMPRSSADGHFRDVVRLPHAQLGWVDGEPAEISAVVRKGDSRHFGATVWPVSAEGISVISDIDDTVKITEVTDKRALIANTFARPFRAAPGMADLYRGWAERGVFFHYVSSSPYQLYVPLKAFLTDAGFPKAVLHLRRIRVKDTSVLSLLADPMTTKPAAIGAILDDFPDRRFVLVGDSGEKDPEVYAEVYRRYGAQIRGIYIRNVTDDASDGERFQTAFDGVPRQRWTVFTDPSGLDLPADI